MSPIWRLLWGEVPMPSDGLMPLADIVVIGAGIAGATTALELRKAGREVLLVEAREAGAGTTGRTTAKVTAGHAAIYSQIVDANGMEAARLYGLGQREALAYFARQKRFHSMIQEVDHHVFTDSDVDLLQREREITQEIGFETDLIEDPGLPGAIAALTYRGQYQIDPRLWLSALLDEYRALGGKYVTGVRVTNIDDGEPVRLETAAGEIQCNDVVVATHFPVSHQALGAPRLSTHAALVVAGPSSLPISGTWISHDDSLGVRVARDGEEEILVISGEPYRNGTEETPPAYHRLSELAQSRFGVTELRYYWSAHDLHTEDHLPYVGLQLPTSKHVWVASGFGSWGMTNGTLAGLMLSKMLISGSHPLQELFDPRRIGFIPPASQTLRESGEAIKHLVGERIANAFGGSDPEELAPGQGCVTLEGTKFVASHRTTDGTLHKVSAACTHLGCLVSWNQGDQTWDCACHGSRFEATGEVIEGPAPAPLDPI
jgi:glycine/D-amino acid oxidase-like deaminating enzyme/nitrite reductase/ring-hydroxylating ferredoxin subunit